jgi:hypothetical protein
MFKSIEDGDGNIDLNVSVHLNVNVNVNLNVKINATAKYICFPLFVCSDICCGYTLSAGGQEAAVVQQW